MRYPFSLLVGLMTVLPASAQRPELIVQSGHAGEVHAVAFHHHPAETAETKFSTLTAVHAADAITSEADPSPLNHDVELDQPYLSRLGLSGRESAWRGLFKGEPVPSASSH